MFLNQFNFNWRVTRERLQCKKAVLKITFLKKLLLPSSIRQQNCFFLNQNGNCEPYTEMSLDIPWTYCWIFMAAAVLVRPPRWFRFDGGCALYLRNVKCSSEKSVEMNVLVKFGESASKTYSLLREIPADGQLYLSKILLIFCTSGQCY